jgi:hypothetical protein
MPMLEPTGPMEKSGFETAFTITDTPVECEMVPLTPVTTTVYEPNDVDKVVRTDRLEVPPPPEENVMLEALREIVGPEGVMKAERLTVPANPFTLNTVMVEVLVVPAGTIRMLGLGDTAKSPCGGGLTVTVTVTAWENDPLVPVTATT